METGLSGLELHPGLDSNISPFSDAGEGTQTAATDSSDVIEGSETAAGWVGLTQEGSSAGSAAAAEGKQRAIGTVPTALSNQPLPPRFPPQAPSVMEEVIRAWGAVRTAAAGAAAAATSAVIRAPATAAAAPPRIPPSAAPSLSAMAPPDVPPALIAVIEKALQEVARGAKGGEGRDGGTERQRVGKGVLQLQRLVAGMCRLEGIRAVGGGDAEAQSAGGNDEAETNESEGVGKGAEGGSDAGAVGPEERDAAAAVVVETILAIMGCTHEGDDVQAEEGSGCSRGAERRRNGKVPGPVIMMCAEAAVLAAALLPWLPCHDCCPPGVAASGPVSDAAAREAAESGDGEESAKTEAGAAAGAAGSGTGARWAAGAVVARSPRTRLARVLATALSSCTRNRAMCAAARLTSSLLASLRIILLGGVRANGSLPPGAALLDEAPLPVEPIGSSAGEGAGEGGAALYGAAEAAWDARPVLAALQSLASHSVSVGELRQWMGSVVALTTSAPAANTPPASIASTGTGAAGMAGGGRGGEKGVRGGAGGGEWVRQERAGALLDALQGAMEGEEVRAPAYTFELDGESSGLLGPGDSKWPFGNGYAFATWIYVESFYDTESSAVGAAAMAAAIAAAATAKVGRTSAVSAAAAASALAGEGLMHMPWLYSFLTAESEGVEAYFHREYLVVESSTHRGSKSTFHFSHAFEAQRWYFIGLEHVFKPSLLGKAECHMRLYVDGRLTESLPLDLPRISRPLGFLCIGTNPPAAMAGLQRRRKQCPLFAEVGPVYIFKEPIGAERMMRLAARGGDHLPCFGAGAGVPALESSEQLMLAADDAYSLDSDLAPRLHLLYHPRLLLGRFCPDASPASAAGVHRRPAEVLGHVHVAARHRVPQAIWQAGQGGPLALLTLAIHAVHPDSFLPLPLALSADPPAAVAAARLLPRVLGLVGRAMRHGMNREEMKGGAPAMLALMLAYGLSTCAQGGVAGGAGAGGGDSADKEVSEQQGAAVAVRGMDGDEAPYDSQLAAAAAALTMAPRFGDPLKPHLFLHLLLHLPLWASCPLPVQQQVLSSLGAVAVREQHTLRAAGALPVLLDGCRRCYWVQLEAISLPLGPASSRSATPPSMKSPGAEEGGGGAEVGGEAREQEEGEWVAGQHARMGEVNALVDAVMGVLEVLLATSSGTAMGADMRTLVAFLLDCPHPNQPTLAMPCPVSLCCHNALLSTPFVSHDASLTYCLVSSSSFFSSVCAPASSPPDALWQVVRVLLLVYRLLSHPNAARAAGFSVQFLAAGGAHMLLALLLRESQWGETCPLLFPPVPCTAQAGRVKEVVGEEKGDGGVTVGGEKGKDGGVAEDGASSVEGSAGTGGEGADSAGVEGGDSTDKEGARSASEAAGMAASATTDAEAADASGCGGKGPSAELKVQVPQGSSNSTTSQALSPKAPTPNPATPAASTPSSWQAFFDPFGTRADRPEAEAKAADWQTAAAGSSGEEGAKETRAGGTDGEAAGEAKEEREEQIPEPRTGLDVAGEILRRLQQRGLFQASPMSILAPGPAGNSVTVAPSVRIRQPLGSSRAARAKGSHGLSGDVMVAAAALSLSGSGTRSGSGRRLASSAYGEQSLLAPKSHDFPLTDGPDEIFIAVVSILGLLAEGGYIRLSSPAVLGLVPGGARAGLGSVVADRGVGERNSNNVGAWAVYGVQRALQLAPHRLLTPAVYHAIMTAVLRSQSSTSVQEPASTGANVTAASSTNASAGEAATQAAAAGRRVLPPDTVLAESQLQLLLALLRALPSAAPRTQLAILQDVLLLVSLSGSNRRQLSCLPEWPEWLLEILLDNLERLPAGACSISSTDAGAHGKQHAAGQGNETPTAAASGKTGGGEGGEGRVEEAGAGGDGDGSGGAVDGSGDSRGGGLREEQRERVDVNEMIFSFLGTVLEHCMTFTHGWKVNRLCTAVREEGMATVKRRLLHGVMDFTAAHLRLQVRFHSILPALFFLSFLSHRCNPSFSSPSHLAPAPSPTPYPAHPHTTAKQAQVEATAAAAAAAAAEAAALASPLPIDIPISPTPTSPHTRAPDPLLTCPTSACLLENAVALLMLLEDFLRFHAAARSPLALPTVAFDADDTLPGSRPAAWHDAPDSPTGASAAGVGSVLPGTTATAAAAAAAGLMPLAAQLSNPLLSAGSSSRRRSPTDLLTLEMLTLMADNAGQLTAPMLERITASTSAEPFEGVRCALPTYGSISQELPLSWGHRSKLWYGVAVPPEGKGGPGWGGGWAAWAAAVEIDPVTGRWQDLPLVVKAVGMLRSMLLDEGEVGQGGEKQGGEKQGGEKQGGEKQGGKGGAGAAEGVLAVVGGIANMLGGGSAGGVLNRASQLLLEDDQTLLTVIRLVAVAARELSDVVDVEQDQGGDGAAPHGQEGGVDGAGGAVVAWERGEMEGISPGVLSSLLWRAVLPLLTTASLDARKQCALAASAVLHTEAIHAIAPSRAILRPALITVVQPPLAALLRKWRSAFAFIPHLTDFEGHNPFLRDDDRALATDAAPHEASLALLQVIWVAALASPPASTALAAMAAAAGPGSVPPRTTLTSSSSASSLSTLSSAPVTRTSTYPSASPATGSTILAASASHAPGTGSSTSAAVTRTSSHHVPPGQPGASSTVSRRMSQRSGMTKTGGGRQEGEREGATSSQRRMNGDKDRAQRWSLGEAVEKAWDCSRGIPVSAATRTTAAAAGAAGVGGVEGREGGAGAAGAEEGGNGTALGPTLGGLQQHLDGMRGLIRAQVLVPTLRCSSLPSGAPPYPQVLVPTLVQVMQ
ncbi:unnamed protein product [Closterium sp. Naga37s-1]|nr:unnamed protein product [Closterium sp. Naga37s-1]